MFAQATIDALAARVGWGSPTQPTVIVLSSGNNGSVSGLTVDGTYPLASAEVLYAVFPNAQADMNSFNAKLTGMRKQAALKVLNAGFAPIASDAYNYFKAKIASGALTYDGVAMANLAAFDTALAWQLVVDSLIFIITSGRINSVERAAKLGYEGLKVELEGVKENGNRGINYQLSKAIKSAAIILFPERVKKPTVRFR